MPNILDDKDISTSDKILLIKFSIEFYQKIININISTFETTLKKWMEWIKNKSIKSILELMKNHNKSEFLFSSIIGFFYQYGIDCSVNKSKALELYLLAVNNEKSLDERSEENDIELQSNMLLLENIYCHCFIIKILF
jgi:hypothetical protein